MGCKIQSGMVIELIPSCAQNVRPLVRKYLMRLQGFKRFVLTQEGYLLPDRPPVPGFSRINPFPTSWSRLKKMLPRPPRRRHPRLPKP